MVAPAHSTLPGSLLDYSDELVALLFNGVPMGVAIVDSDFQLRQFNPTWANFIARYTHSPVGQVVPGANFLSLAPGIEHEAVPLFEEVLSGKVVKREALRLESEGITSYWDLLLAPLMRGGRAAAVVIMTTDATDRVRAYEKLARTVAERTDEAEQRQHIAEGLRDLVTMLNSARPLQEVLHYILAEACRLLGAASGAIFRATHDEGLLRVQVAHGLPTAYVAKMTVPLEQGAVGRAISTRQPVMVRNIQTFLDKGAMGLDRERQALIRSLSGEYRSLLALPVMVKEDVYGGFVLYYPHQRNFSPEEIGLASTIGDHLSLAVGNDRLRMQVEQAAVAAERGRLARDLHDSVTQTLFSASLIAEVLPRLCERDPAEGRRRLRELRELTRGALAEMRTLLLELRPASLTEVSLGDLLKQLSEAIIGRTAWAAEKELEAAGNVTCSIAREGEESSRSARGLSLSVHIDLEKRPELETGKEGAFSRPPLATREPKLPPDVQIALYRIAQEALNNVARHSRATAATLSLRFRMPQVTLSISDNGRGFDPKGITPEHLGVSIMHERAASIGAKLDIRSRVGKGTEIEVVWREQKKEESGHERI